MTAAHNVFLRGLNAIYQQTINVGINGTEKDKLEFAEFAAVWAMGIHEHHGLEESFVFPEIERLTEVKGLMDANVQQHVAFHDGMERYESYLKKVLDGEEKYDGPTFRDIIDSFGGALSQHLNDEIPTLRGLRKFENVDWDAFHDAMKAKVMEVVNLPGVKDKWYPFALSNNDRQVFGGLFKGFPATPWFVTLILGWFYVPTHKRLWRFSSCTVKGVPQELPFA